VNAIASAPVLEARDIDKMFGGLKAVVGVSFGVKAGEILGIAGPNGAGKTTLFDVISGLTKANGGSVLLDGQPITNQTVTIDAVSDWPGRSNSRPSQIR